MITKIQFSGKNYFFIQAIIFLVVLFIFANWVTSYVEIFDPESELKRLKYTSIPQTILEPDGPADIKVTEYVASFLRMKYATIPSEDLPWWDDPHLGSCKNSTIQDTVLKLDYRKFSVLGNCGYRSSLKGSNQNIVSFSLYGDNEQYWSMLSETINTTQIYYPRWQVRIYLNPRIKKDYLCEILLLYPHVSICDVENLPPPLGNLAAADPMLWRSAPMGDSTVARFAVRDTDSVFSSREQAAVAEWVKSGKLLHVMRDHPQHGIEIMGGLFGIHQPPAVKETFKVYFQQLLKMSGGNDQVLLRNLIYNDLKDYSLQHDSYLCKRFPLSVPYPTRREGGFFLGAPVSRYDLGSSMEFECPVECRPKDHQDWLYC